MNIFMFYVNEEGGELQCSVVKYNEKIKMIKE